MIFFSFVTLPQGPSTVLDRFLRSENKSYFNTLKSVEDPDHTHERLRSKQPSRPMQQEAPFYGSPSALFLYDFFMGVSPAQVVRCLWGYPHRFKSAKPWGDPGPRLVHRVRIDHDWSGWVVQDIDLP